MTKAYTAQIAETVSSDEIKHARLIAHVVKWQEKGSECSAWVYAEDPIDAIDQIRLIHRIEKNYVTEILEKI